MMDGNELKAQLASFTGTAEWYRHPLMRKMTYTEGVKYLADNAEAYWLIDKVATLQLLPKVRAEQFQVWTLKVWGDESPKRHAATLTCTDGDKGGGPVTVHTEKIDFTDFPLPEIKLYCADGVIMLPSEY